MGYRSSGTGKGRNSYSAGAQVSIGKQCMSYPKHGVLTRRWRFLANSLRQLDFSPRSNTPWPEVCYHTANQRALGA